MSARAGDEWGPQSGVSPLCPELRRVPEQDWDGDMKGPPTKVSCFQ